MPCNAMNFNLEGRHADTMLHLSCRLGRRLCVLENEQHRWLEIDGVVQSVRSHGDPSRLCLPHQDLLVQWLPEQASRILELGLGGGDMIRHLAGRWPAAELHCVDLDDEVIELYRHYFQGEERPALHLQEAHAFLQQADGRFDLILLDLFSQDGNPPLLFQPGIYQILRERLAGRLLINLLPRTGLELERVLSLCERWLSPARVWPLPGYRNCILMLDYPGQVS